MTIITAPHQSLRQKAPELKSVDAKVKEFIKELEETLRTSSRRGVGLAAPQIDRPKYRIFTTYLSTDGDREDDKNRQFQTFINPRLTQVWGDAILGPDEDDVPLEGCLSIPSLYGPVPRYQKIRLEYDVIRGDQLKTEAAEFADFFARVIQHELDHLNGVLFTDYVQEYDLPLYQENPETGKLKELTDRSVIELF